MDSLLTLLRAEKRGAKEQVIYLKGLKGQLS